MDISEFPIVLAIPLCRIVLITYHTTKRSAEDMRKKYKGATLARNPRFTILVITPDTVPSVDGRKVTCSDKREE